MPENRVLESPFYHISQIPFPGCANLVIGQCPVSGSGQSKRLPYLCIFGFLKYRPLKFLACCIAGRKYLVRFRVSGPTPTSISGYPEYPISAFRYRDTEYSMLRGPRSRAADFSPVLHHLSLLYRAFISLLSRLNTTLPCPSSYPLLPFSNMDTLQAKRDALRARCLNPPGPSSLEGLRAPSRRQYVDQRNLWES